MTNTHQIPIIDTDPNNHKLIKTLLDCKDNQIDELTKENAILKALIRDAKKVLGS